MASAGPHASLHLAPDRQPPQHPTTQFFTGQMPFLPPNKQRRSTEITRSRGRTDYRHTCRTHCSVMLLAVEKSCTWNSTSACWPDPEWQLLWSVVVDSNWVQAQQDWQLLLYIWMTQINIINIHSMESMPIKPIRHPKNLICLESKLHKSIVFLVNVVINKNNST